MLKSERQDLALLKIHSKEFFPSIWFEHPLVQLYTIHVTFIGCQGEETFLSISPPKEAVGEQ